MKTILSNKFWGWKFIADINRRYDLKYTHIFFWGLEEYYVIIFVGYKEDPVKYLGMAILYIVSRKVQKYLLRPDIVSILFILP